MFKSKPSFRYVLPVILSLVLVLGYYFWLRASAPSQVEFTADTIISLEGTEDGDLYVAQGSACSSFDIAGKNLAVFAIPEGSTFTLKTFKHGKALQISSVAGSVNLDFSSDNLLVGDVSSWTLSSSGTSARADIVWGVPEADTRYSIKINGVPFNTFSSNASSEIIFSYNITSDAVFTLEAAGVQPAGGSILQLPKKPDAGGIIISYFPDGGLSLDNLSDSIVQIAISFAPDFISAAWENIGSKGEVPGRYEIGDKLYLKFRTKQGGVSDPILYIIGNPNTREGDIVKTADNFDVYIIKYQSGKRFKRLILNPYVFDSYEHLKWSNIKVISLKEMNSYSTSALVKETNDRIIYELFPDGDAGERRIVDVLKHFDADSVYEINRTDLESYKLIR